MEYLYLWTLSLFLAALLRLWSNFRSRKHQQPPGPPGWPIVGNMFDLGPMPHQTLYNLRSQYGPVVWLKLGSVNTLVVQSAKAATELFKNHDHAFSDRMVSHVLTAHNFHLGSLGFAQNGENWLPLRRLFTMELHGNKRVSETAPIRRKCVDDMVRCIGEESAAAVARGESGVVSLRPFLFLMAFNVVGNLTLSKDLLLDANSERGGKFYDAMNMFMKLSGTPNVADFLPWLKWLDPQGLKKKMERDMGQAMRVIDGFVKERIEEQQKKNDQKLKKDFLDALLEFEFEGDGRKISNHNMVIFLMEMFLAGSDTTSSALEWAMAELLRHPEIMAKVKEEIDRVVGRKRKVEETDMDQLPYLQAVLKEVLRLHSPLPLLLPRKALEDTKFMGYLIPKNTQVFVNAWAIGRDSDCWEDPLLFKPERFLKSRIEYKGQNFELIPFGSGRRMCAGMPVAHKVLHLALASLLHSFDWELERSVSPRTIDMSEKLGITVRKLVPLKAIPNKRSLEKNTTLK